MTPNALPDPVAVALEFTELLDRLGIRHLVGGSLASSVHGEPRSTNDIDILANLSESDVEPLVDALRPSYYVDETAMREAIRSETSFNAIHISMAVKVDVFIAGKDPFNRERLRLRQRLDILPQAAASMYLDTAEHSVLRKLEWYRRGHEVSERQWRDVVSILRIQGAALDSSRLDAWGERLGVLDLLEKARAEASA